MLSKASDYTRFIKESALRHGFMGAGIARAEHMDEEARRLEQWLKLDYQGEMAYMANHFDMRVDPTKLVPGAKSVVSLLYNYYPSVPITETSIELDNVSPFQGARGSIEEMPDARHADARREERMPDTRHADARREERMPDARHADARREERMPDARHADARRIAQHDDQLLTTHYSLLTEANASSEAAKPPEEESFKISRYAFGEDYHKVVRRKLKALVNDLKKEIGDFNARVFVDSAPVLERDWAKRSGQGWIGKNTLLINPKKGSYFFLAEIILDVELEYDHPMRDHCGTCTKCIDACPTEAISPNGYVMDGSKCISYLTIELKSQIPDSFKGKMENWIYGCDICQEVCPWNRFSTPHSEPAFEMSDQLREMKKEDWQEITEEVFGGLFSKSAVKRAGYNGLTRNIRFLSPADQ
jgi:epoxyqueuosine reductase